MVSVWEPSQEEIEQIIANKKIYVVLPLKNMVSMSMMTASPFKKEAKVVGLNGKPLTSLLNGKNKNKKSPGHDQ